MTPAPHRAAVTAKPLARLEQLLDPTRLTIEPEPTNGYLNVLETLPVVATPASRLMRTWYYPLIYQVIRPLGLRLASGLAAPGRDGDRARTRAELSLKSGDVVLDVACGPGNFTGYFGSVVGPSGLAIGVDTADSMLKQAVRDNSQGSVAYLRADAAALPFPDASFNAVTCFAALYLINNPERVVAELARIVKPGGRVVILTSFEGRLPSTRILTRLSGLGSGMRFFSSTEVVEWLRSAGATDTSSRVEGLAQTVSATF
jgi:SAM-dependent methyltransferase